MLVEDESEHGCVLQMVFVDQSRETPCSMVDENLFMISAQLSVNMSIGGGAH